MTLVVAQASSPPARAAPPCGEARPWVELLPSEKLPAGLDRQAVVERLGVELHGRGMDLCIGGTTRGRPAVATIRLDTAAASSPGEVVLEIELHDDVTSKRVSRAVELTGITPDGRASVVALAADELLRASWAELELEGARVAARPAPPEVRAAVAPRAREPSPLSLGVRAAAEFWSAGLPLFGGDAVLDGRASRRLSLDLVAGARAAPEVSTASGGISVLAASLRAGARLALADPSRPVVLSLGARASGYLLRLSGDAAAGVVADDASAFAFAIEVAPRLVARLAPGVSAVVEAGPGFALRGVEAVERATVATGLSGVAAMASLGLMAGGP